MFSIRDGGSELSPRTKRVTQKRYLQALLLENRKFLEFSGKHLLHILGLIITSPKMIG